MISLAHGLAAACASERRIDCAQLTPAECLEHMGERVVGRYALLNEAGARGLPSTDAACCT